MRTADVVVVGAGIIGLSAAYHLARRARLRVVLLERGPQAGAGETAKATGGIRQQFSTEINVRLVQLSVPAFERFDEEMGTPVDFARHGYLFLTGAERLEPVLRAGLALQQRLGVPSRWVSPADVAALYPAVRADDLRGGTFCPADGSANPYGAVQGYLRRGADLGVEVRLGEEVTAVEVDGGRIRAVRTPVETYATPVTVNAAGVAARHVGALAGVDVPVFPYRRQVFVMTPLPPLGTGRPLTVDLDTGWYVHQDRAGFLYMGGTDKDTRPGTEEVVDWDGFDAVAAAALRRVPAMAAARVARAYAGVRSLTPDHHAILGRVPGVDGLIVAAGFSGHGFMQAPAAGRLVAEEILDGGATTLDLTPLSITRFRGESRPEAVAF